MRKEYRNLILLFLFAFILRLIFLFIVQIKYWDETVYISLAKDLAHNFFNYSLNGAFWSDYIPFGQGLYSWPNIGFRAPLLPVTLSFLYRFNLDFLVDLFIPFVGAASSVLVYFLGKKIFNVKAGLYAGILFSLVPLNLLWGSRISTGVYGVFFLLLSFIFFWKGFEEKSDYSKILFGVFLALAILSRYTVMWIIPVFLIYFLIRDKNLRILGDKYLWFSILSFFGVLIPWFFYGLKFYSHPLGAFIHGTVGASFWGGVQAPFFYLSQFWSIFSVIGIIFLITLFYLFKKKYFFNKRVYLLLIWFFFFLIIASFVPHKEERFILILVPPLCLLSGFFLSKLKIPFSWEKEKKVIFRVFLFFLMFLIIVPSLFLVNYEQEVSGTNYCFLKGLSYIGDLNIGSLIYSDEPPVVYAYTDKKIRYYPSPWDNQSLERGEDVYVLYTDYDKPLFIEENVLFREDLKDNFELVFECDKDWGITEIYRVGNFK